MSGKDNEKIIIPDKDKIGDYILEKMNEFEKEDGTIGLSKSELAEKLCDFANAHSVGNTYKKENFKDSISKWTNSNKSNRYLPNGESLYFLSRVLNVSMEEIYSCGEVNSKYDDRRITLYALAQTKDLSLMEKALEQGYDYLWNCDEFDMNLLDYLLKFKNIKVIEFLCDKGFIEYDSFFGFKTNFLSSSINQKQNYKELLMIIIENDNLKLFKKFFDTFRVCNSLSKMRLDNQTCRLQFSKDELNAILTTNNIFEFLSDNHFWNEDLRCSNEIMSKISEFGHDKTLKIENIPVLSGLFNPLLNTALETKQYKKAKRLIINGIKHNNMIYDLFSKVPQDYVIDEDFCFTTYSSFWDYISIICGVNDKVLKDVKDQEILNLLIELNASLQKCGRVLKPAINVVNLHITDKCNFNCEYCYVKKEGEELSLDNAKKCVDKIRDYFRENRVLNDCRINIAGGEPFLYPHLKELVDYIYSKNIKVSIVTNGFSITEKNLSMFVSDRGVSKIDTIGISVDALKRDKNLEIGRSAGPNALDEKGYIEKCALVKKFGIKLKINICVSKHNMNTDFSQFLSVVQPFRLKLLKMSIQEMNSKAYEYEVSDKDFADFAKKYIIFKPIIETKELIQNSYIIIDSRGCVSTENGHKSNISLLENTFEECLNKCDIDYAKFQQRYN